MELYSKYGKLTPSGKEKTKKTKINTEIHQISMDRETGNITDGNVMFCSKVSAMFVVL